MKYDQRVRSASDYALLLKDLPPNPVKEDIIRHFSNELFLECNDLVSPRPDRGPQRDSGHSSMSDLHSDAPEEPKLDFGVEDKANWFRDPFVHEMCIPLFDVREVVLKVC